MTEEMVRGIGITRETEDIKEMIEMIEMRETDDMRETIETIGMIGMIEEEQKDKKTKKQTDLDIVIGIITIGKGTTIKHLKIHTEGIFFIIQKRYK